MSNRAAQPRSACLLTTPLSTVSRVQTANLEHRPRVPWLPTSRCIAHPWGLYLFTPYVELLSGWPWVAVPSLTVVVVLLVLAGHWAVVSLGDGDRPADADTALGPRERHTYTQTTDREQAHNTPSIAFGG